MRKNRNRNRKAGKDLSAKPKLMSSIAAAGPQATPDPVKDGGTDNFTIQQSGADAVTPAVIVEAAPSQQTDNAISKAFVETSTRNDGASQAPIEIHAAGQQMRVHPLAKIFPLPSEDDLRNLADNIAERGLLDPVVLLDGKILDGRCRYLACALVGVECKYETFVEGDPLGYVVSRNLHRRHLTESQRAMVAAKLANMDIGANQHTEGVPIGRAAKLLNVGKRSVSRQRKSCGSVIRS
jgi:hypothetical protein